ncbi:MAG: zinc metalloprotease HtpX [Planctomycetes bacterium]|nr:zinc metalloprotease HtpX [Planctomycetota bacterium]
MDRTDFYREIAANKRRTFVLMFVFALVIILLGWALGFYWGRPYIGLGLAFVVSLALAWGSYYHSDGVVLAISRARPVEKSEYPHLYNVTEGLAIAAGVPAPRCYVIDEPTPNAFATGRDPQHACICVTTGLLEMLDRYELEGVVAHEMSHIRNYDIRLQTLAVVMAGMVVLLGDYLLRSMFWGGRRRRSSQGSSKGGNPVMVALLVIAIIAAILSPLIAQALKMAISRKREFLADATAVQLTRYPEGLASALEKLSASQGRLRAANKATAHLFIVNPLRGKGLDRMFSTHPPLAERIARLRAMDIPQAPQEASA